MKYIAEIGVNHDGHYLKAIALIMAAKQAGATAVKFQMYRTAQLVHSSDTEQFVMLSKYELSFDQLQHLLELAHTESLEFGVSVFDEPSMIDAYRLRPDFIKIPSGEITDYKMLKILEYQRGSISEPGDISYYLSLRPLNDQAIPANVDITGRTLRVPLDGHSPIRYQHLKA